MCKRAYCKYFKLFADGSYRYELRDWNEGTDYGFLEPELDCILWILSASPASSLIPSLSYPWNCSGRKVSFLESISDLFLCQQGVSWKSRELCFEGLAWPGLLHLSLSNIWPLLYWGDTERVLTVTTLTEMDEYCRP